ncbi:MAG: tagaturonate epimerase family protein [Terrimicrobiaceae bacterium]|nr:tagaturonate epimerase family protein [Terrimicrobiaceae bacterium]
MKILPRFTFGVGDRFGLEGRAQLSAICALAACGSEVCPVWNKSNREHSIVGSEPASVRAEADEAVKALGWRLPYFVDADHIGLSTVDRFLESSDFFTVDVADCIGRCAAEAEIGDFCRRHAHLAGSHELPGLPEPLAITNEAIEAAARKFLLAMREAAAIHRHIAEKKTGDFAVEVSVDETTTAQSPAELFLILAMLADAEVPVQTIAPKFTGRFNKGVDYEGDLAAFERDFEAGLAITAFASKAFGLPGSLKLSVHSGSDKFSIYPVIRRLVSKHGAGLHVKTAGTTWLEEVAGLAEAGGSGLALAREIYAGALARATDLIAPYATVVDIEISALPSAEEVASWTAEQFTAALDHDRSNPSYNPNFRQLLHVAFKIAASMGQKFTDALLEHRDTIERRVRSNLLERHLLPLFPPQA